MSYNVVTEEFEVRSVVVDKVKTLWAKGYAAFKGLDTYGTKLSKNAMRKVAQDLKTKDIKIGIQHQRALGDKVTNRLLTVRERLIAEGKSTKELDEALSYNAATKLPIGKPRNVSFDEEGVMVEVEINSHLQRVDPVYYNAVSGMLQDKFFDGFSIEFNNPKIHDEYDSTGARVSVIDDLTVSGLELVSGASNSGAQITDVFVRMAGQEKKEEEIRMANEEMVSKEEFTKLQLELKASKELAVAESSKVSVAEAALVVKSKEFEDLKVSSDGDKPVREELEELKILIKDNLNKGILPSAKGVVAQENKFAAAGTVADGDNDVSRLREELSKRPLKDLLKDIPEYK